MQECKRIIGKVRRDSFVRRPKDFNRNATGVSFLVIYFVLPIMFLDKIPRLSRTFSMFLRRSETPLVQCEHFLPKSFDIILNRRLPDYSKSIYETKLIKKENDTQSSDGLRAMNLCQSTSNMIAYEAGFA